MKTLFNLFIALTLSTSYAQAADTWRETEVIESCIQNFSLWNYRVKITEYTEHSETAEATLLGHIATLSEYNVFTNRERILRPSIPVTRTDSSKQPIGTPTTWTGEDFKLNIYPNVVDGFDGFYSEFKGIYLVTRLNLKMGCK